MICMNCISEMQEIENKCLGLKILLVFDKNVLIMRQLNFRGVSYIRLGEFKNSSLEKI